MSRRNPMDEQHSDYYHITAGFCKFLELLMCMVRISVSAKADYDVFR